MWELYHMTLIVELHPWVNKKKMHQVLIIHKLILSLFSFKKFFNTNLNLILLYVSANKN